MVTRVMRLARSRSAVLAVYLAAVLGVGVWCTVGGPALLLAVLIAGIVLAACCTRMTLAGGVAVLVAGAGYLALALFVIIRVAPLPPIVVLVGLALAIAAGCTWLLMRHRAPWWSAEASADLCFASIGGVIWLLVMAGAQLLPSGTPFSWAMYGDAANNLLFARGLIEHGGIAFGPNENPVPLTATLIAVLMLPATVSERATVAQEVAALSQMWSAGIVLSCLACGVLVLAASTRRGALRYIGASISSLLPLSWLVLAGALELGFVNFALALALIVCCLILVFPGTAGLTVRLTTLTILVTLVLAVWSPLAAVPGAAIAVVAVSERHEVAAIRGARLATIAIGVAQAVAFFVALPLPSLFSQGDALSEATGAVLRFPAWLLGMAVGGAALSGILYTRLARGPGVRVVVVAVAGGALGLGVLLWLRRGEEGLWGYYQVKMLWLLIAFYLVVSVALAVSAAASLRRRDVTRGAVFSVALLFALGLGENSRSVEEDYRSNAQLQAAPLVRPLLGQFFVDGYGDRFFERVTALTDAPSASILWRTGDPDEAAINFWIIQMLSSRVDNDELRTYAYVRDPDSVEELCRIRALMGPPVIVWTADSVTAEEVEANCADLGPVRLVG